MSYFKATLGRRPAPQTEERTPSCSGEETVAKPYFGGQLGPRSRTADQRPTTADERSMTKGRMTNDKRRTTDNKSPISNLQSPPCPLCRAVLSPRSGLHHCQGRCGTRWLEVSPGQLVDVAMLSFGVCSCCPSPQALVKSNTGVICPESGQVYVMLDQGALPLAKAAPEGLCQCCLPPLPLVRRDAQVVCPAKPYHQYERHGEQLVLIPPTGATNTTETLSAIDAALRRNTARVTLYGLFDVDD